MNRYRILFVSIAFPPKADSEGLQVAKYFKYLSKNPKYTFEVVTSKMPTLNMPFDQSLKFYSSGVTNIITLNLFEKKVLVSVLFRTALRWLLIPDFKFMFHLQYRTVLKKISKSPDLIYSRSFPLSSTIMGYKLSKKLNVPWVMHLSDPWADCFIEQRKGFELKMHRMWERKCFERATLITFTTNKTLEHYSSIYPEYSHKYRMSLNVYDPEIDYGPLKDKLKKSDRFRIVYTGVFRGEIGPQYVLDPLNKLFARYPNLKDKVEIIFAGTADNINSKILNSYNLSNLHCIGRLDYLDAMSLQKSADLLIAIDEPTKGIHKSIIYPSKILDYLSTGNSILGLTDIGTTTYELLTKAGADTRSHLDIDGIYSYFLEKLQNYSTGQSNEKTGTIVPVEYSAKVNAARLMEEFDNILYK